MTQPTFTLQEIAEQLNRCQRSDISSYENTMEKCSYGAFIYLDRLAEAFGLPRPDFYCSTPFTVPTPNQAEGET